MLQITLPEELERWAVENAVPEGFETPEALIVAAVRDLRARQEAARKREAELLVEALESGEAIQTEDVWWNALKAESLSRIEARAKNGSS